jgi:glyoxylase-like metal-dependent hydrolase (beta-lactamase superfamily II)
VEWLALTPRVAVLKGPVNCGVVVGQGGQALVVDSGMGSRSGRQIAEMLAERGLRPAAVLNTHAHGDHTGGNAYLVREAGARLYAPEHEATWVRSPEWGMVFLFGGAEPVAGMTTRRLLPEGAPVHAVVCEGTLRLAGVRVEALHLPGHTRGHMGYLVEGVLFLGDALASEAELASGLPYTYSVSLKLQTLERLESVRAEWYVPGHGEPRREIAPLLQANREAIEGTCAAIQALLAGGPMSEEEVVARVFRGMGAPLHRLGEFSMARAAVLSHLSYLHGLDLVAYEVQDGRVLWRLTAGPKG